MFSSLHDFLQHLERIGDLHEIDAPVSPDLEIAAIVRRISNNVRSSPALLFRTPAPFSIPVAANLFGSRRRMRLALGLDSLNDLTNAVNAALAPITAASDISRLGAALAGGASLPPSLLPHELVPCREEPVLGDDLLQLPFHRNWPADGSAAGSGRYITLGQVATIDPEGSRHNYGIYRCQIHDSRTLAIRWRKGSGAAEHHRRFIERNERMPVAIVLGGPPTLILAAAWPLPPGIDELAFAGWLRGVEIPMVACPHGPLQVPAEADIVIEGFAEPDQPLVEGPFGNHTGRYDPAGPAARVTVTRITRRRKPVLPITVVGPPPQEDCWMMLGWERMLAAMLPRLVPGIRDIFMPLPWVFRQSAIIALENPTARSVRETAHALWRLPWFAQARLLVLVESDAPLGNLLQVAWRVVNEPDWSDDLIRDETGRRLAIDATRRSFGEGLEDPATERLITGRWQEYGLP
ncbi:UbiD family decarboxylase [Trichlorobacter ammonificans]|uniref:3-polyprenyl-4-hydroxybenzoate carboxy-lyase n=1 Tax=Trichlorobacter ammonificans TaxID=2916410 RepID=A0ABM9DBN7_9BACT|nr:UbiD family decarboxylase [Trichlorobacter ammonificans]CAH2032649.1 3-polyprenyl-4-hydroxybenzoate carboxy-lyase [Trichlorobacter ammonificans]